jgi:hypothetical protein
MTALSVPVLARVSRASKFPGLTPQNSTSTTAWSEPVLARRNRARPEMHATEPYCHESKDTLDKLQVDPLVLFTRISDAALYKSTAQVLESGVSS